MVALSDGNTANEPQRQVDRFVALQAILAGLPMYALQEDRYCGGCCCAARRGGCFCCCHPRVIEHMPWVLPCSERIEVALLAARKDYPQFKVELGRLRVEYASHDVTIFVDDEEQRMFTSLRGTDCRTCRDLSNDVMIFLGCWLCRTKWVREEYCHTRIKYPEYCSYGCGHSLGGTVITELACLLEHSKEFAFDRVDVFNTAGSPISRGYRKATGLDFTEHHAHRVRGDLVSLFFRMPGTVHEHPARPEFCTHSLKHFLPEPIDEGIDSISVYFGSFFGRRRGRAGSSDGSPTGGDSVCSGSVSRSFSSPRFFRKKRGVEEGGAETEDDHEDVGEGEEEDGEEHEEEFIWVMPREEEVPKTERRAEDEVRIEAQQQESEHVLPLLEE